jgi:3',5'-cyclic-AMP phosphodiesterase
MENVRKACSLGSIVLALLMLSCDNPFSYSPFEARVPAEFRNTTEKNLDRIRTLEAPSDTAFTIALISDSHYHFNNLKDALDDIDSRPSVRFIIVIGDVTENGLQKEYEIFHTIMSGSVKPWLTVVGNHDHLSNGGTIYQQMFGELNYSFTFGKTKFVIWDNIRWESNRTPDWEWLRNELASSQERTETASPINHVIAMSHIPPFDTQLLDSAEVFNNLLRANSVEYSMHGHKHTYSSEKLFDDGDVTYVTVGSPQHRTYTLLTILPRQMFVEQINY